MQLTIQIQASRAEVQHTLKDHGHCSDGARGCHPGLLVHSIRHGRSCRSGPLVVHAGCTLHTVLLLCTSCRVSMETGATVMGNGDGRDNGKGAETVPESVMLQRTGPVLQIRAQRSVIRAQSSGQRPNSAECWRARPAVTGG